MILIKHKKYIIDNDIKTRREFQSSPHRGLYKRARLKGFLKDLKFQKEQTNWSENYKTIEDVQNFIDKENIPNIKGENQEEYIVYYKFEEFISWK